MSDATPRPAGGPPEDPGRPTPDARGETALGTGPVTGAETAPGARADHAAGTRPETTPGMPATGGAATGTERTAGAEHAPGAGRTTGATGGAAPSTPSEPLLPHEECEKLEQRLQHAVAGFVDGPQAAVEEADRALEEIASRLADAVTQRRRTLRMSWQTSAAGEDKPTTGADTEQLRLALRDYRELADRMLRL
ncbi:hypothetical protein ACLGIH_24145 [Streptomyces sp. HMX87]|uniref:hypothetical protein n=1 Tax=Streptomyces sp. HMX87 TaxID=3390849 RepID=UPI003A8BFE52